MTDSVYFWRICADKTDCAATDLSGRDAADEGGRWNERGVPMVYAASSRSLACLESLAHLDLSQGLPEDRWLIEIAVPRELWEQRQRFDPADPQSKGWDRRPQSEVSIRWGNDWARARQSLAAEVPSVIVAEECNVLLNPRHAHAHRVSARRVRRWLYDPRLT